MMCTSWPQIVVNILPPYLTNLEKYLIILATILKEYLSWCLLFLFL